MSCTIHTTKKDGPVLHYKRHQRPHPYAQSLSPNSCSADAKRWQPSLHAFNGASIQHYSNPSKNIRALATAKTGFPVLLFSHEKQTYILSPEPARVQFNPNTLLFISASHLRAHACTPRPSQLHPISTILHEPSRSSTILGPLVAQPLSCPTPLGAHIWCLDVLYLLHDYKDSLDAQWPVLPPILSPVSVIQILQCLYHLLVDTINCSLKLRVVSGQLGHRDWLPRNHV